MPRARTFLRFDDLPLFATIAIVGPERADEFRSKIPALEGYGFPAIDRVHGGRYVPAVRRYYDVRAGVIAGPYPVVDGPERPELWHQRKPRRSAIHKNWKRPGD